MPSPDTETLAEVLAAHDLNGFSCACGRRNETATYYSAHRVHLAEALAVWLDERLAEAEVRGQMRHITAEMLRGDQPLEAKEELIADLRARLSHVEAERDALAARIVQARAGETALRERVTHEAADALVAYARDTFWRDDSPFHKSSRHSYEAAAAWLHEYASQATGEPIHLLAPKPAGDALSVCGDQGHVTTTADDVTCGWCRVAALDTTGGTP